MVLRGLIYDTFSLLFPRLCNACGEPLCMQEKQLCTTCLADLPYTDFHRHADNRFARQFWGRMPVQGAVALFYFRKGGKIQEVIHNIKYRGQGETAILLGQLLGQRLLESPYFNTIDEIIPVPLHPKRQSRRGYNQAALLAEGIGQVISRPLNNQSLIRKKSTASQTTKSRFIRHQSIQDVFGLHALARLENKHILLVDDVMTTGATLEACGQILLNQKIRQLSIATLAFTC